MVVLAKAVTRRERVSEIFGLWTRTLKGLAQK